MAAAQKTYELLFKLKASLGGNFNGAFKSAIETNKKLQESIKSVNSLQSKVDGYTRQAAAIDQQKAKLAQLREQNEKVSQSIEKHRSNAEQLRAKIDATGDASGTLTAQLIKEQNEVEKGTEKQKKNEIQIQQTTARIREQTAQLDSAGRELREAGVDTDNLEKSNGRLAQSYEKLRQSQNSFEKIRADQAKIQQNISSTKLQLAGTVGAVTAVAAAVYAGPVKAAQGFQTSLAKVSTIADEKEVPMAKMSQSIMQLSNTTGIAAGAIAEDVYNAISAGQKTGDAVNFVSTSTKLAKAGFAESAQTLDVLTTILNAYGMSADKVNTVSDMLVQTQNKGKTTVGELSSVMGKIIPTAKANSVGLEQITAGYAIMTSKGIAAAETTTYMNSMLNEMSKSGTTADKTLRKTTGQSFKQLMESGKSLGDVIGILQQSAESGGKSLTDMFGSAEAGKAAVSLLSGGVEGFNTQVQGMVDSVGSTDAAFEKMEQTTEAKMQKARNSISNLSIVIGQNLLPIVGTLADKVAAVVVRISEFAQENPKLVQTVMKVAGALAGLKIASLTAKLGYLEIANGVKTAQSFFGLFKVKAAAASATSAGFGTKLTAAGKGITGYFGSVKTALSGVTKTAGSLLTGSPILKSASTFAGGIAKGMTGGLSGLAGKISGPALAAGSKVTATLLQPFSKMGGAAAGALSKAGLAISNSLLGSVGRGIASGAGKLGAMIAPIGNVFTTMLGPLGKLGSTVLGPLGGIAGKILPVVGVVTAVITVIQLLREHIETVRAAVGNVFGEKGLQAFDKFIALASAAGETIKNVFSDGNIGTARNKINEIFGDKGVAVFDKFVQAAKTVQSAVGQIVNFITTNVVPVAANILALIANDIVPGIISALQAAAPTIMAIVQSIAGFIGSAIPLIGSFIAGLMPVISGIVDFIRTSVLPIIGQVVGFVTGTVLPGILSVINTILPAVQGFFATVLPLIQSALTTIWNVLSPVLSGILAAIQAALPVIISALSGAVGTITSVIGSVMTVLQGIISFVTGVFSGNWAQAWEGIKMVCSGALEGIKTIFSGALSFIDTLTGGKLTAIKTAFSGAIETVKGVVQSGLSAVSGFFQNCKLSLPKIKLPHFKVSGKLSLSPPSVPKLSIDWYKKGGILTGPTIFGASSGNLLGGGEAGKEAVLPLSELWQNMRRVMSEVLSQNTAAVMQLAGNGSISARAQTVYNNYTTNNTAAPERVQAPQVIAAPGTGGGGVTLHLNSPTTVYVNGDKPGDLENKLEQNNRRLIQEVEDLLDKKADDERRMKYE